MRRLLVLAVLLPGCIRAPTAHPHLGIATAPPPPALVPACQTLRTWQNVWVVSGTILSALGGSAGGAEALSTDKGYQTGVAIGALAAGVLAAVATTAAGIDASSYALDDCQVVLQQAADATH